MTAGWPRPDDPDYGGAMPMPDDDDLDDAPTLPADPLRPPGKPTARSHGESSLLAHADEIERHAKSLDGQVENIDTNLSHYGKEAIAIGRSMLRWLKVWVVGTLVILGGFLGVVAIGVALSALR